VKSSATLELEAVTIAGGNVLSPGGGILNFGTLKLTDSTVSGNSSEFGAGGGIVNVGKTTLTNSTVSGNSAQQGGGIFTNDRSSRLILINSTLSGNTGILGGNIRGGAGKITFRVTLLDTGSDGPNCAGQSLITFESLGSNVAADDTCFPNAGTDRVVANGGLLLGPLADNGGPTETHALLAGSPAIDFVQGSCDVETDQRGLARPFDGDGDGAPICDSGAFERRLAVSGAASAATSPIKDYKRDEDDGKKDDKKETDEQRERTNRSNRDDYATEGNVLAVEQTPDAQYLLVTVGVTKNEKLIVRVACVNGKCPDIRVGDYLEADGYQNGVGDPNTYFIAEEVTVVRGNKRVK